MNKLMVCSGLLGLMLCFASSVAYAQQIAVIGLTDVNAEESLTSYKHVQKVVEAQKKSTSKALDATRKFDVLSRDQVLERFQGRDINLKGFYDKRYANYAVQQTGLDYLLKLEIAKFGLEKGSQDNSSRSAAKISLNYTLFAVSGEEDVSGEITAEQSLPYQVANDTDFNQLLTSITEKAAHQLSHSIAKQLHPIRLSWINEDELKPIFNYGKGMLSIGDRLAVYAIVDEYNNPNEEFSGNQVGIVEIERVDDRFAYSRVIEGYTNLRAGQVAQIIND